MTAKPECYEYILDTTSTFGARGGVVVKALRY